MTFSLSPNEMFWWPVTVHQPDPAKPGQFRRHSFEAKFERLDVAEDEADQAAFAGLSDAERNSSEFAYVCRRLKGWRDVTDQHGDELPFTAENLKAAWNKTEFRIALNRAYVEALSGDRPRLGN